MSEPAIPRPGATAAAIQSHYDIGNAFYSLWLDPSHTYSCALWYGDEDLHTAQLNKLDWHLEHSRARGADRLLDVGCGWGALLQRATEAHGVRHAIGLSLSSAQNSWIKQRQLSNVEVHLENWAEHMPSAPYDAIVSVGAFEHFARLDQNAAEKLAGYRAFFTFCHRVLQPRCWLTLQTITYQNSDRRDFSKFFAEKIFPESDLPHLAEIVEAASGLFEIEILRQDRSHYARTARAWLANLKARSAEATALVGAETVATYKKYLGLLVVGFHTGTMNLARIAMRRSESRLRPSQRRAAPVP